MYDANVTVQYMYNISAIIKRLFLMLSLSNDGEDICALVGFILEERQDVDTCGSEKRGH